MEITQAEQKKEKGILENDDHLRDLWDNIKHTNIHIIRVPEGEEREKEAENLSEEIIAKKSQNLGKRTDNQVQETQRVPNKVNPKGSSPRHITIKMAKIKDKERSLKVAREKQLVTYTGIPIKLFPDFSAEMLQARRQCHNTFKVMKGKNLQPRLLYQEGSHSDLTEKSKALQISKFKRIQHGQTSSTTNAKGTSLSGKHKRRKGPTKTNPKQLRKWS